MAGDVRMIQKRPIPLHLDRILYIQPGLVSVIGIVVHPAAHEAARRGHFPERNPLRNNALF
jgi:hypothetical protein